MEKFIKILGFITIILMLISLLFWIIGYTLSLGKNYELPFQIILLTSVGVGVLWCILFFYTEIFNS